MQQKISQLYERLEQIQFDLYVTFFIFIVFTAILLAIINFNDVEK